MNWEKKMILMIFYLNLKGLRSASDQIAEATKYIRYMQNKVRQLKVKRDKMMKSAENNKKGLLSSSKGLPITVRVQRCTGSAEVLIFATAEGRSLRLSSILQLLVEEGLNVVDCNCTKFDGRLHCTIQCEVLMCVSVTIQFGDCNIQFDLCIESFIFYRKDVRVSIYKLCK